MLSTASILGQIVPGIAHRYLVSHDSKRLPDGSRQHLGFTNKAIVPRKIYSKRVKNIFDPKDTTTETRDCCVFRYVDAVWQRMTRAQRDVWKRAVKKRYISGYDLFMSENLYLALRAQWLPDGPSRSGGFSFAYVVPGTRTPPPPCLTWLPVRWANIEQAWPQHTQSHIEVRGEIRWNLRPSNPDDHPICNVYLARPSPWQFTTTLTYPETKFATDVPPPMQPIMMFGRVFNPAAMTPTIHCRTGQHWTITRPWLRPYTTPAADPQ
ncbi:MAG: hypothetical protein PHE72_14615 [candidate division Zixibacteria bacterium]|nr:hypothetical protein [candidate division Zixibacteria bacterium]